MTYFQTLRSHLNSKKALTVLFSVLLILVVLILGYYFFFRTPQGFKQETVVEVSKGEGLTELANQLVSQHVITSSRIFIDLAIFEGGERKIVLGDYIVHSPENLFVLVKRFLTGNFEKTPITITIPEGSNVYDIAEILSKKFASFNPVAFLQLAKNKEGYLFPDTYFLYATIQPQDILTILEDNFTAKTNPLLPQIAESGHSLNEIITMASILEGEAKTTSDRKIVSGILWKRLSQGIPLQVDSSFRYINGKTSAELTLTDLKTDSPYNTYLYKGLPPTPISNPGLDSIEATLSPATSTYLYFLSDDQGVLHYASTLKEHEQNIAKYLKR